MEKNVQIVPITYRRKEIGRGIILGQREHKYDLRKFRSPLWAKTKDGFVSQVKGTKKNVEVWIDKSDLKIGTVLTVQDRDKRFKVAVKAADDCRITLTIEPISHLSEVPMAVVAGKDKE